MEKTKFLWVILFLTFFLSFCQAQSNEKIKLTKIIFHSSRCNGTCPSFNLEIDSSRTLFVNREYFKTKSQTDERFSGQFKGVLSQENYNKLLQLLQSNNIDSLTFPNSSVMDLVHITIIVYYNGKRKYLTSPSPPEEAKDLIDFLTSISDNKTLERTTETRAIEY